MLDTPEERIRLLKTGINGKTVEYLYLKYNNFKILSTPLLFDFAESTSSIELLKKESFEKR